MHFSIFLPDKYLFCPINMRLFWKESLMPPLSWYSRGQWRNVRFEPWEDLVERGPLAVGGPLV